MDRVALQAFAFGAGLGVSLMVSAMICVLCAEIVKKLRRVSDGTATAAANGDLPVPQDCQARAVGNAQETQP